VAVCRGPAPTEAPRALVGLAGGTVLTIPLDRHGADMLRRFRARDCGLRRLDAIASFTLGSTFRLVTAGGREQLRGVIEVRRHRADASTAAESVTVTDLTGSVLYTFTPVRHLPVTLTSGQPALRIPVLIGPEVRCDAHGLSQSTQTFLFSAYARINGAGPQQRIILVPADRAKAQAQAMLERACR
jgi:hypothetical protein